MLYDIAELVRSNSSFIAVLLALLVLIMGLRERRRGRPATSTPVAKPAAPQTPNAGGPDGQ